jgi:hypothetical protein
VHILQNHSNAQPHPNPSSPILDSNRESSGLHNLEGVSGGLHDQNGKQYNQNPSSTSSAAAWNWS